MTKEIFKHRVQAVSDGSATIDIVLKKFPTARQGCMKYITVEDETTAFTRVQIGIRNVDQVHWLVDMVSPLAGYKYWISDEVPLEAGEEVIARFTGTTSADILTLTGRGWMWPARPGQLI